MTVDEVQIGSMAKRRRIDAVITMRRLQEEHNAKGKVVYVF